MKLVIEFNEETGEGSECINNLTLANCFMKLVRETKYELDEYEYNEVPIDLKQICIYILKEIKLKEDMKGEKYE